MKNWFLFLLAFTSPLFGISGTSGEIFLKLQKLNTLGSVLYVAAHPDDENTSMITYFANDRKMRTAYLSLTRGDGGQNLIGPEKGVLMGMIRTQELLEARRVDGGEQYFTRAFDFGYSKSSKESFEIWNKDSILRDVVYRIRKFRPDIIITRFSPDREGRTHGHHTASAILAIEAFSLAGDKNVYPDQLEHVSVWQPKRVFWNTSWWFYGTQDYDKTGLIALDLGGYNTEMGKSYGEISAESRSMHKSQGFGRIKSRGKNLEYLDPKGGDRADKDPFEGINTSWSRVKKGSEIGEKIEGVITSFDHSAPEKSVKDLLEIRQDIQKIKDEYWKTQKTKEIDAIIQDCLGLYSEVIFDDENLIPGFQERFTWSTIQRAGSPIKLLGISSGDFSYQKSYESDLEVNVPFEKQDSISIPDLSMTQPYWLVNDMTKGRFKVDDAQKIGLPENPVVGMFQFDFEIYGQLWSINVKPEYKWRDRVRGEMRRDVVISNPVSVKFIDKILLFPSSESKSIRLKVSAVEEIKEGELSLNLPSGWKSKPEKILINLGKGMEKPFEFNITPPSQDETIEISARIKIGSQSYEYGRTDINYDHIKPLSFFQKSNSKLIRVDLQNTARKVGYIKGAGDEVPACLEQMGSDVQFLQESDFVNGGLEDFDAIVIGVRAYNTQKWLPFVQDKINEFVSRGGNVVVQYNTSYGLISDKFGPYKIQLSRDRVTKEDATIKVLAPNNFALNMPNKIIESDFENWIQERGLYFPSEWDENLTPVFECNDPGEDPKQGSLLVGTYGRGTYVYTGLSFFRELPAGVPGAYRIFANLISAKRNR